LFELLAGEEDMLSSSGAFLFISDFEGEGIVLEGETLAFLMNSGLLLFVDYLF
jgi:hypothetical protein